MAPANVGSEGNPNSVLGFLAGVAVGLLLFSEAVVEVRSVGKLVVALRLLGPELEAPSIGEAEREFVLLISFFFLLVAASESLESELKTLEEPSLFF